MLTNARRRAQPRNAALSDAEWEQCCKTMYERQRLTGAKLRQAEAARRKAGDPPPTLMEALEKHLRERHATRRAAELRVRAHPRFPLSATSRSTELPEGVTEAPEGVTEAPESATSAAASDAPARAASELAALFAADPVLAELAEAAALPPEERFRLYGWLVGLPYGVAVPEHMADDSYRWELPAWSLKARYDGARDDYFLEIVDGRMDERRLSKLVADRKYAAKPETKAKRALHADELALTPEQRAHLRRLRARLANAQRILGNVQRVAAKPERVALAQSYVDAAAAAIRRARGDYGLPESEAV